MSEHEGPEGYEGYEGEVTVTVDGEAPRTAHAALAARFDPLAGHVVWSGRLAVQLPARTRVLVTTPHGSAAAETTETDAWGNSRLSGIDRPPFPVALLDAADDPT